MVTLGQRVRHRKQPTWGVGTVAQVIKVGDAFELVIDFADQSRRLRLKPDLIATMIEVASAEELAAHDAALAAERSAASAARAVATRARAKQLKSARLSPTLTMPDVCLALAELDGQVVMAMRDLGCLRVCQPDGDVLEDIAVPEPEEVPGELQTRDGLVIGTRVHGWGRILFARRGGPAQPWRSSIEHGVTEVTTGVETVVHDLQHVVIAREDGATHELPLVLGGRTVGSAVRWGDGVLVGISDPATEAYFHYLHVGLDGTIKHQGLGGDPTPLDDDTFITFDRQGVQARDRAGTPVGRLDLGVTWSPTTNRRAPSFARVDDELVFTIGGETAGLVRWHPHVDQPRWTTIIADEPQSLVAPVRVGRFVAVTHSEYAEPTTPRVWVVDAETGALVHVLELKQVALALIAVGDDTLVAHSYAKQITAWRGLSQPTPERLSLVHAEAPLEAVSPGPGALVTTGGGVSFFEL
ncbi:MAG: DUF3553 domain-containing protein [Myxococcota bacterium]|nr:DUF3553 domain-containing protein [Myxococcota bacterium]